MEYIDLIRKFWKLNETFSLNASAVQLYFYLLEYWDRNNKEDFEHSDVEISEKLKISRKTIKSSKEILRNLGLINFQIKNGFPTSYKIIIDYNFNSKKVQKAPKLIKKSSEKTTRKETKTNDESIFISAPIEENKPTTPIVKVEKTDTNSNIPTLEEFMQYAKTIEIYNPNMDFSIKSKYETWKENGWRNGYNMPIKNWKQSLNNVFSYLSNAKTDPFKIPTIVRPKQTYDE